MFTDLTLPIAFTAGLVSFFSPCFFPVLPGFFAFMGGIGATQECSAVHSSFFVRMKNVLFSLAFIAGFASVFFVIGVAFEASLSFLGIGTDVAVARKTLSLVGGSAVIVFGLSMMNVLPLGKIVRGILAPFRFVLHTFGLRNRGLFSNTASVPKWFGVTVAKICTAFLFGAGFAAAWSPCIGAVLGSVLSLAVVNQSAGMLLFGAYVFGFGLPLLIMGFFAEELGAFVARWESSTVHIQSIFGSILVVIGMCMILFPPQEVLRCFG